MSEKYKGWSEQQYIEKIKELEETIELIIKDMDNQRGKK